MDARQFIVLDTETTDLNGHVISIAYVHFSMSHDCTTHEIKKYKAYFKKKEDVIISQGAYDKHQISSAYLAEHGLDPCIELTNLFVVVDEVLKSGGKIVCHNARFDVSAINRTAEAHNIPQHLKLSDTLCTMVLSTQHVKLPGKYGYKWPKNLELFAFLYPDEEMPCESTLHDALVDTQLTQRSFVRGCQLKWW